MTTPPDTPTVSGVLPPPDSGITPEDIARARLRWRALAPPAFRDLLDAPVEGE